MSKALEKKTYFERKNIKIGKVIHREQNAVLTSRDIFFFGFTRKFCISIADYKVNGNSYPLHDEFYNYHDSDPQLEIFSFTLFKKTLEITKYYGGSE